MYTYSRYPLIHSMHSLHTRNRWTVKYDDGCLNFVPTKDKAHRLIPASRLAVPKSDIFSTPLNMLTRTFAPLMSR